MTDKPIRKLAKAVETRKKVVAAAQAVWAKPGSYEKGTIRVIAAKAGMTTGAVFSHFEGKEDLWREAMGHEPPTDCAEVREVLKAAQAAKAAAKEMIP